MTGHFVVNDRKMSTTTSLWTFCGKLPQNVHPWVVIRENNVHKMSGHFVVIFHPILWTFCGIFFFIFNMHRSISIIYPKMEGHSMIYFGGPARSPGSARHGSNFRMHACAAQGAKNHGLFGGSVRQPTLGEPRAVHICAGHKADCLVARGLASSENH